MIVLHAALCDQRLAIWGESPPEECSAPAGKRGRMRLTPSAPRLPYDAGAASLREALEQAGIAAPSRKKRVETAVVWLPSVGKHPIPSSPLVADRPKSRAKVALNPWEVTCLFLSVGDAVELLCTCMERQTLAPGVVVGRDLVFWMTALRFAAGLVARQQFLPGIATQGEGHCARWEPVLAGSDNDRLAMIAAAMPAVARALAMDATVPPAVPAAAVLSEFVGQVVDHLVRAGAAPPGPRRGARRKRSFDSVHDQWVHALRSPDGRMDADAAELDRLADQIRDWRRPISVSAASGLRLCFRLEEPDADAESPRAADKWVVRYLVQAMDDPSLLVPAKDAWSARGRKAALLERNGVNVREYLLSALGQASGICDRVEASLKKASPGHYTLKAAGAHEFLTQKASLLEQAGFGVMLPAWWTPKGTKVRLTARAGVKSPTMRGGGGLSLADVVSFDWQVALGEERLTLEELTALADLKSPLVRVRGQWVQLSGEEIQAAIDLLATRSDRAGTVGDVVQMALGANDEAGALAFGGVAASGWIGDVLAQLQGDAAFDELSPPAGFRGKLRPYQVRGYSWLAFLRRWGLGACLADDMGLGKTIQALTLIQRDWESNGRRPVLLICPMSVVGNWHKEAARFTPKLPVMVHHGVTRAKGESFREQAGESAIVISSYALLHRDVEILSEVSWAGVILDEAQNIKNSQTKQARAARSVPADYRIALTGTPVENNVGDLWSIMEFLNPGSLGTQADFKRRFFIPIQANRDPEAADRLKRMTGPFILRRLKTDKTIIDDLPEKMEMKVFCTLTREQASLYAAVAKEAEEALDGSDGIQRKGVVLATLSKLKQVCNHPAQFLGDNSAIPGRSGKLTRLVEMLDEIIEVGDRALVFSQFSEMGEILQRHVQETFGREVAFLHGGVPKKRRDLLVERFQADDGPAVFILSLKAGGTGLNLTAANHVFHFDRWWNPAVENQATDRAFRIGQTKNVQVHKFSCVGTLEEKIDEMIERKREIAEQVVGTGEGWLTELSTAELKEIFALREGAVAE